MFRRPRIRIALAAALFAAACGALPTSASACPLCKFANEDATEERQTEINRRPQAYMYSILFMLSMPATLLAGFSFGFYRLWKKQQLLNEGGHPLIREPEDV
ncbi:MAG: hypothetical protein KF774_06630 [Planctomyces sp.]|nr:hypothetical protein [Planctomyces sp.]